MYITQKIQNVLLERIDQLLSHIQHYGEVLDELYEKYNCISNLSHSVNHFTINQTLTPMFILNFLPIYFLKGNNVEYLTDYSLDFEYVIDLFSQPCELNQYYHFTFCYIQIYPIEYLFLNAPNLVNSYKTNYKECMKYVTKFLSTIFMKIHKCSSEKNAIFQQIDQNQVMRLKSYSNDPIYVMGLTNLFTRDVTGTNMVSIFLYFYENTILTKLISNRMKDLTTDEGDEFFSFILTESIINFSKLIQPLTKRFFLMGLFFSCESFMLNDTVSRKLNYSKLNFKIKSKLLSSLIDLASFNNQTLLEKIKYLFAYLEKDDIIKIKLKRKKIIFTFKIEKLTTDNILQKIFLNDNLKTLLQDPSGNIDDLDLYNFVSLNSDSTQYCDTYFESEEFSNCELTDNIPINENLCNYKNIHIICKLIHLLSKHTNGLVSCKSVKINDDLSACLKNIYNNNQEEISISLECNIDDYFINTYNNITVSETVTKPTTTAKEKEFKPFSETQCNIEMAIRNKKRMDEFLKDRGITKDKLINDYETVYNKP